jgi:hypothetical protein
MSHRSFTTSTERAIIELHCKGMGMPRTPATYPAGQEWLDVRLLFSLKWSFSGRRYTAEIELSSQQLAATSVR